MTTPKEALEQALSFVETESGEGSESEVAVMIRSALASLEGDAVERVARIIAGPLCDATKGEHSIMAQGNYRFCTQCGETISKRTIGIVEARNKAAAILSTGLVPDEAAIRAAQQSDDAFDIEEMRRENAENVRTLDAIADYVGCPHDEELTVDHVRQHYMKLENAAQRQGVEDAGRIANAQAYRVEREAAVRADWHTTGWDRARNSGRILLVWREFAGVREHVELGRYSDSKTAWVNTYGRPFHADPDGWAPLLPFKTAEAIRADERGRCAKIAHLYEAREVETFDAKQLADMGRELSTLRARVREVVGPLARLTLPEKPQGNAGAYSIFHSNIRAARQLMEEVK